jgi:hypothetical protein
MTDTSLTDLYRCQRRILAGKSPCIWSCRANEGVRLEAWDTFAEICGTAAATLTGLLFVAVSIKIASIVRSQELRNRAAQS